MNSSKLKTLEQRARALHAEAQLVTVCFSTGQRRTMRLPDVIPLLQDGAGPRVVGIEGEAPAGSGQLLELLQGLTGDVPEITIL